MNDYAESLNPWFAIWCRPRDTMDYLLEKDPEYFVIFLVSLQGMFQIFFNFINNGFYWWPLGLIVSILIGPFISVIFLYITSILICITGGLLGGQAGGKEIRTAIAWSTVPQLYMTLIWLPLAIWISYQGYTTEEFQSLIQGPWLPVLIGLIVVQLMIGIWSFFVGLKCLGEVQGFSAIKAFLNYLLVMLLVGILFAAFIFILFQTPLMEKLMMWFQEKAMAQFESFQTTLS